jgi:hypothetical protein
LLPICANGPLVWAVSVGGAVRRYESRNFSRKTVQAGKPPWRNFCKSRRKIICPDITDLSRAEVTNLADERRVKCHDKTVKVRSKNCDKLIAYTSVVMVSSNFKTVKKYEIVLINEICHGFKLRMEFVTVTGVILFYDFVNIHE